jgi:guanylate kinase
MHLKQKGKLYTIAAPSGAGKTSLVTALIKAVTNLIVSVSYTTRAPRASEVDGVNYHFVDAATFKQMIEHHDFLEYATVFHHLYGTSKSWVERQLIAGKNIILEIDWQGVQQIKRLFPDSIGIFILPPSIETLQQRLLNRQQDSLDVIAERLALAKIEISHAREADFLVINDQFEIALENLKHIVETGQLPPGLTNEDTLQLVDRLSK